MTIAGKQKAQSPLVKMVFAAVLVALIVLMTFTGIGYIPIGPLKLTFNVLPVAVGAVVLGPLYGSVLGLVFGLSSFFTCFGMDALGTVFLGINPILLFIMCVFPRIICGLIPALIFKFVSKYDKTSIFSSALCCMLTPLLNTVGFVSLTWIFFAQELMKNPAVLEILGGISVDSLYALFALLAGTNAIIEAAVGLVFGSAICKALFTVIKKFN